jgi:hypothetical protein
LSTGIDEDSQIRTAFTYPACTPRSRRLAGLGATITGALSEEGLDHYAAGMKDPEGNEFDIN